MSNHVGQIGSAAGFIALGFVGCDHHLAAAVIIMTVSVNTTSLSGYCVRLVCSSKNKAYISLRDLFSFRNFLKVYKSQNLSLMLSKLWISFDLQISPKHTKAPSVYNEWCCHISHQNWIGVKIIITTVNEIMNAVRFILWKIDFHACYFISSHLWKTSLKTFPFPLCVTKRNEIKPKCVL